MCTMQCVVGCQCKSGFYRNNQGACVALISCQSFDSGNTNSNRNCAANEEYKSCGTACEPSCQNPKPTTCTMQCVARCQCKSGFYRNSQNVCVTSCSGSGSGSQTCATMRCPAGTTCQQLMINCIRAPCPQPPPRCVKQQIPTWMTPSVNNGDTVQHSY
ncbi:unnamed protein product [Heligmosomoides polygyrus]|uniref:TIL domain-containing protein n=1 Tax=Heligmosomoides polygyrus TaxID=6339 RepID=A0A183FJA0_HELPZ|nr:unnamed protein product [Heligmosomoides polygyrus]